MRDLVRDFCRVCVILAEQKSRFSATGTISHAVLRELLGRDMRKGVFWRLKDTAHQLFRVPGSSREVPGQVALWQFASGMVPGGVVRQSALEGLLDWCIGYAFHECVKLKEDAFQRQHYANRLLQMRGLMGECENILTELEPLTGQTRESIGRELTRIHQVLHQGRGLLIRYLGKQDENGALARWLLAEDDLARTVFAEEYATLLDALYGGRPERLHLLAAEAYLEGGRPQQALEVLDALRALGTPDGHHGMAPGSGSAGKPETQAPATQYVEEAQRLRVLAENFDVTRPLREHAG